jgi:hypothetical protein
MNNTRPYSKSSNVFIYGDDKVVLLNLRLKVNSLIFGIQEWMNKTAYNSSCETFSIMKTSSIDPPLIILVALNMTLSLSSYII